MKRKKRSGSRKPRRRTAPPGAMPGEIVVDGKAPSTKVRVLSYDAERVVEREVSDGRGLRAVLPEGRTNWVDVQGLGSRKVLETIGEEFGLHPLTLADVVHTPQRPKVEAYGDDLFLTFHAPRLAEDDSVEIEQVSLFVTDGCVITFQETHTDRLEPLAERIRGRLGRLREGGPKYLAYTVIDLVIDLYFPLLEDLGDHLDKLESDSLDANCSDVPARANQIRGGLLRLRRSIWPERDVLSLLARGDAPFFLGEVQTYLRDCYDHCIQIAEIIDSYREMTGAILSNHLGVASNRMNEIMAVLTVLATIFIPLTFLTGVYGMNFEYMPELHYRYAYPIVIAVMVVVAALMLLYFGRRGWIGRRGE